MSVSCQVNRGIDSLSLVSHSPLADHEMAIDLQVTYTTNQGPYAWTAGEDCGPGQPNHMPGEIRRGPHNETKNKNLTLTPDLEHYLIQNTLIFPPVPSTPTRAMLKVSMLEQSVYSAVQ